MEPDNYFDFDPSNNHTNGSTSQRTAKHTQFLDLTNGAGGEVVSGLSVTHNDNDNYDTMSNNNASGSSSSRNNSRTVTTAPAFAPGNTSTAQMSAAVLSFPGVGGGSGSAIKVSSRGSDATTSGEVKLDPSTPGRVVQTGQEHTGRWTKEEHDAFLGALKMYGKEWKKVAAKVKTRTVVQTRTHAQKYFQKLAKTTEGKDGGEGNMFDMGTASDSRNRGGSTSSKKKHRTTDTLTSMVMIGSTPIPTPTNQISRTASVASSAQAMSTLTAAMGSTPIPAPTNHISRTASVASAAQVMSTLTTMMGSTPTPAPTNQISRTASVASAAQVMSTLSRNNNLSNSHQPLSFGRPLETLPSPTGNHGFQISAATAGTIGRNGPEPPSTLFQPTHGFSSPFAASITGSTGNMHPELIKPPISAATKSSGVGTRGFPSMKIVAPDHDSATKQGKFPEPSPAACGKRKLAEIAAARMLAGVAASEPLLLPSSTQLLSFDSRNATVQPLNNNVPTTNAITMNYRSASNIADAEDGTATPPPEPEMHGKVAAATTDSFSAAPPGLELLNKLPNSAVTRNNFYTTTPKKAMGLSLQIVNPETLGFSHEEITERKKDGSLSPVTPWEGQLQALVSEEKRKVPLHDTPVSRLPIASFMSGIPTISLNFSLHPVCGPGSAFGRSTLHKAVCDMDVATLQSQLSLSPDSFDRRDEKGYCPIHSACALCLKDPINSTMTSEIVRMLITAGADVSIRDLEGNTSLHWAARAGDKDTVELLLVKNNPKDAKNERGETPLHWAMRSGRLGIPVASILLENGARPSVWNTDFKRPIDVAADGFYDESDAVMELRALDEKKKKLKKEQRQKLRQAAFERKEARANLFDCSPQSRTLVLYHPECLEHIPKAAGDWENPSRISSIMGRIKGNQNSGFTSIFPREIQVSQEFERAKLDLLSRVHSTEYLNFVNELSKDLERQHKAQGGAEGVYCDDNSGRAPVVPFTPMVQRSMIKVQESKLKMSEHSDTSFSAGSLRAARRAAGAVQHAVDCVLVGRHRNAFCIVRPPGHHAGINGLLDGGESCGFCIFNSVAAGAMHAISNERLMCERCAIVDFDAHHGNGTEEIVRKCHDPGKLFFFSIHVYDNDKKGKKSTQYKFYPGTGDEDDLPLNIINVPITPLWKETNHTSSVKEHNTRHRTRTRGNQSDDGSSSESGTPRVSDAEIDSRIRSRAPSPVLLSTGTPGGRAGYRNSIQNRLLPALRAFNPDLILISAGFDACKNDVGNAKHEIGGKEKMGIDLEPEDYAWTTRKILEIADICCQGRVVSVLEGGYGRHTTTGVHDPAEPLDKSLFSECAIRHAHAMIDPYDAEERFGPSKSK